MHELPKSTLPAATRAPDPTVTAARSVGQPASPLSTRAPDIHPRDPGVDPLGGVGEASRKVPNKFSSVLAKGGAAQADFDPLHADTPQAKAHAMQSAPKGRAEASVADFATPPLSTLPRPKLDKILEVGHIRSAAELGELLTAAGSAVGAGSAEQRLVRVLKANGPPHTPLALEPAITAQREIDEKILRGRLQTPLPDGVMPSKDHRTLIGGHSPRVRTMPETFAVASDKDHPNKTSYASIRRVARGDTAGMADAIGRNLAGNVVEAFEAHVTVGTNHLNAPPAFDATKIAKAPAHLQTQHQKHRQDAIDKGQVAIGQFAGHVSAARAAANALVAGGDPGHATRAAAFVDAVQDAKASAKAILTATTELLKIANLANITPANRTAVTQASKAVDSDFAAFETNGPVMTRPKDSTLAPARMSEDEVLALTDGVAATPATLFRDRPSNNAPADGTLVSTKHQSVNEDILWIAMKDNVTYRNVPAVTLTGGSVTSFYPTMHETVPSDPAGTGQDLDGYSTVH